MENLEDGSQWNLSGWDSKNHRTAKNLYKMKTPTTSSAGIRVMMTLSTKLTAGDGRPLCENPGHLKREKMIFSGAIMKSMWANPKNRGRAASARGAANEGTFDTYNANYAHSNPHRPQVSPSPASL